MKLSLRFRKRCHCCGSSYSADGWQALPLLGITRDEVCEMEWRNCVCSSTLVIERSLTRGPELSAVAS